VRRWPTTILSALLICGLALRIDRIETPKVPAILARVSPRCTTYTTLAGALTGFAFAWVTCSAVGAASGETGSVAVGVGVGSGETGSVGVGVGSGETGSVAVGVGVSSGETGSVGLVPPRVSPAATNDGMPVGIGTQPAVTRRTRISRPMHKKLDFMMLPPASGR
jgi:hypothetical protein